MPATVLGVTSRPNPPRERREREREREREIPFYGSLAGVRI